MKKQILSITVLVGILAFNTALYALSQSFIDRLSHTFPSHTQQIKEITGEINNYKSILKKYGNDPAYTQQLKEVITEAENRLIDVISKALREQIAEDEEWTMI